MEALGSVEFYVGTTWYKWTDYNILAKVFSVILAKNVFSNTIMLVATMLTLSYICEGIND